MIEGPGSVLSRRGGNTQGQGDHGQIANSVANHVERFPMDLIQGSQRTSGTAGLFATVSPAGSMRLSGAFQTDTRIIAWASEDESPTECQKRLCTSARARQFDTRKTPITSRFFL